MAFQNTFDRTLEPRHQSHPVSNTERRIEHREALSLDVAPDAFVLLLLWQALEMIHLFVEVLDRYFGDERR